MTDHARPNWAPGMPETGPQEKPLSTAEFRTLPARYPEQAFIIGAHSRPGFTSFVVEVEYTMYLPDTPKNAELELIITEFPLNSKMMWWTVIVPMRDLPLIMEVGKKHNFTFKNEMLPMCIDEHGEHWFPMDTCPNVYSIEGILQDEMLLKKYQEHWEDVIDKHQKGLPWKV